jgi:hypothetical protein
LSVTAAVPWWLESRNDDDHNFRVSFLPSQLVELRLVNVILSDKWFDVAMPCLEVAEGLVTEYVQNFASIGTPHPSLAPRLRSCNYNTTL